MKMAFLQQQHEKCLKAIELIGDCEQYIKAHKHDLQASTSGRWYSTPAYHEKQIAKYTAIRQRLVKYYSNQFLKMVDMAVEAANI